MVIHIRRREVIGALGAAAAWPLAARAQKQGNDQDLGQARRIGALFRPSENDSDGQSKVKLFERTFEALGRTRSTLHIDYYWDITSVSQGNVAISKLLKLSPDVIFAGIGPALIAAKAAT